MELGRGPLVGAVLTVAGGVVIAVVPFYFADLLSIVGFEPTLVGPLLGGLVALSGLGACLVPALSRELGIVAILMSVLSLFGALGGLLVGLVLGVVGGSLCVSWTAEES